MTFTRKNRIDYRSAPEAAPSLVSVEDDDTTEAMRAVIAHTTVGWNALRHAC